TAAGEGNLVGAAKSRAVVDRAVSAVTPVTTKAYMIAVNGRDVVAVPDEESARAVVAEIKDNYASGLKKDGQTVVDRVDFAEKIAFAEKYVEVEEIRTKEEAERILLRGTDKLMFYTVQRGDSLWRIAQTRNMKVEDIQKANPDVKPEAIQPGQQINLVVPEPYLNLKSAETYIYQDNIPYPVETVQDDSTYQDNIPYPVETVQDDSIYPWESYYSVRGIYGKKEIVLSIERENGQVTKRSIVSEKVLSEPVGGVYRKGTKLAPKLGTGRFVLPLAGEFTSGYGPRWGEFHRGIDIAAPEGTPVVASDSGTVIEADWKGRYGKAIMIDHGEGRVVTLYGHLRGFAVDVGDAVKKGQVIGYEGNTGYSTGPHVHFEIQINGRAVNPTAYFPD
ncbi:MAG: peptidoglycan DD-metalloendopeptidase family protein, partial [Actinobacteria bacterium]|nr:peptidoglycan DD-metalloendopeptidase family protein [Actinomycetota bacterium]